MLKRDLANIKDESDALKSALDELEQYGRRECVEIRGIPPVSDENTNKIVIKLASKVGINITETRGNFVLDQSAHLFTFWLYANQNV